MPDFAPAVPPVHGVWLARQNRDEAVLGRGPESARVYGRPRAHVLVLRGNEAGSPPEARRAGGDPGGLTPVAGPQAQLLKAYRVVASLPKGLSLDVLA